MRFMRVAYLISLLKRKRKPREFPFEKEVEKLQKCDRTPKVARTGKLLTEEEWDYIMKLKWETFERFKLEIMRKYYPVPVTPEQFRAELGGKGSYIASTFSSINDKLYRNHVHAEPYKVEGERDGFQVFHVLPVH